MQRARNARAGLGRTGSSLSRNSVRSGIWLPEENPRTLLCKNIIARTTIDLTGELFRRTKAAAALRGLSLKELITAAIEKELDGGAGAGPRQRVQLPLVRMPRGCKLQLENFDFDDLLA